MNRRDFYAILFWLKVSVAFMIAVVILALEITVIVQMRQYAVDHPYRAPPGPPVIKFPSALDSNFSNCFYDSPTARLEPPANTFLWGFDLQWDKDTPEKLVDRIGKRPGIFNAFIKMNNSWFEENTIVWNAQSVGKVGGILELTLDPNVQVDVITNLTLYKFALLMRHVNSVYGTPVLLRFMHEMNGSWRSMFGMRPIEFVRVFRTLSTYIHSLTNMTAMLWSPNIGNKYPFLNSGFDFRIPKYNETNPLRLANFNALNTNNTGASLNVIDIWDDPYGPYYPGDEYVDWVGISVYNLGMNETRQTSNAPLDVFTNPNRDECLLGVNPLHNFYQRFVVSKGKPFIVSETGSSYVTNLGGNSVIIDPKAEDVELDVKRSWWQAILTTSATPAFNLWKAATWFEETKIEQAYFDSNQLIFRDYLITFKDYLKRTFIADTATYQPRLKWANQLNYTCSGQVLTLN